MFNTYVNGPSTLQVKVEERRAPTDESIRLYDEMREKALRSVLVEGWDPLVIDKLQWTVLDCPTGLGIEIHLSMFINGNKCESVLKIRKTVLAFARSPQEKAEEVVELIHQTLMDMISRNLAKDVVKGLNDTLFERLFK